MKNPVKLTIYIRIEAIHISLYVLIDAQLIIWEIYITHTVFKEDILPSFIIYISYYNYEGFIKNYKTSHTILLE